MKKILTLLLVVCFFIGIAGSWNLYSKSDEKKETLQTVLKRLSYLDVLSAYGIIKSYSGPRGTVKPVRENNSLIIRDTPEKVAELVKILEAIDIKPVDLQFTIDLILGSKIPAPETKMDKALLSDPLIKELRTLLRYNSFKSLDTTIIKVQDKARSSHRIGDNLLLRMEPQVTKDGDIQLTLRLTRLRGISKEGKENVTTFFDTRLSVKNKERTVVGVSKLDGDDKALILIIAAKIPG